MIILRQDQLVIRKLPAQQAGGEETLSDAEIEVIIVIPEFDGTQISVGFNAQYLNEFFNVIQDGQVAFEFKDSNSQAQIRPQADGDYDFRYVVMPMRL